MDEFSKLVELIQRLLVDKDTARDVVERAVLERIIELPSPDLAKP